MSLLSTLRQPAPQPTSPDRFFGAFSPFGISTIRVSNSQGGTEIDHIQYGY
ncbi:MAG: hypothetical protein Q8L14_27585 [Myxococcales bacterium]|nr:hypothetical protein [Myxococcales bacterium]